MDYWGLVIVFSIWVVGCIIISFISFVFSPDDCNREKPPAQNSKHKATKYNPYRGFIISVKHNWERQDHQNRRDNKKRNAIEIAHLFVLTVTLIVLSITCVAIILQVNEMRKAYDPINDSAKIAVVSGRPWVALDSIQIVELPHPRVNGVIGDRGIRFQVAWRNRGHAPALEAETYIEIAIVPRDIDTIPHFVPNWDRSIKRTVFPVPPDFIINTNPTGVIDADRDRVFNRDSAVIVYSAARYVNPLDANTSAFSEVCFKITYNGEINDQNGSRPNWDESAVGPQNTIK